MEIQYMKIIFEPLMLQNNYKTRAKWFFRYRLLAIDFVYSCRFRKCLAESVQLTSK